MIDPKELRARRAAELADDPERQARVARVVARLRRRGVTAAAASRPLTAREQWADFEATEAANEREHERTRR